MIAFTIVISLFIFLLFSICFFAFDNLVLGGVISRKMKRWAENKFESGCTQDCNQGRNCKCGNNKC